MSASSAESLTRAVVDTNLFVSGLINPSGTPARLLDALREDRFILVSSQPLIEEVLEVLARPQFARYAFDPLHINLVRLRVALAEQVTPASKLPVESRDRKDNMLLACALGGAVDYLVTGDQDLLVLDHHPALGALRINSARAYLTILGMVAE